MTIRFASSALLGACMLATGCDTPQKNSTVHEHAHFPTGDQRPLVGVHEIKLNEGVTEEAFDAFVSGPFAELWKEPIGGVHVRVDRGDRGQDDGQYLAVWSFDSVACRNRYFPTSTEVTQAFRDDVQSKLTDVQAKFDSMCSSTEFTDFVVLFSTEPVEGMDSRSLYGVHNIELRPGVSEETFEDFVTGAYAKAWQKPIAGIGHAIVKGERGAQVGAYKLVITFTPASLRDEYIPSPTQVSKFFREEVMPQMPSEIDNRLRTMVKDTGFTDYAPVE
ncbi:MAG: hypothetical protein P8J45_06195 [Phycisphaerales bacterium]|nr:hypothetical protein [Phycisphaerales bacterium]